VYGVLDHKVYGVLVSTEEVVHLELVEADEVLHLEPVDFEDVVHFELVDDVLEGEHEAEVVFDEEQGVEVVLVEVQGVEVVLDLVHLVDTVSGLVELEEMVQRLLEVVVHGLVDVVEVDLHPVEHDVLVQMVAGVIVQVLQLVATVGLPAVVILKTSQCLEVVVAGRHSLPDSHTTVGQTGPVS
jgi:hypothetical protein